MSTVLPQLLADWKKAFDEHHVDDMGALFTEDALFQGFGPDVLVGREAVKGYYDALPDNRSTDFEVLHEYEVAPEAVAGFADVTFSDTTGWSVRVHLSLVARADDGTWRIRQYHVSIIE
ncbi:SgcJ/EcaC family oxidoreductase [Streptomyces sp. NPDC059894]|uniref:SgcJ/EcaC family oxidoreductase n=1 Tax=unclassified Streptomyces TaxID=2593676 RepID=UPI003657B18D